MAGELPRAVRIPATKSRSRLPLRNWTRRWYLSMPWRPSSDGIDAGGASRLGWSSEARCCSSLRGCAEGLREVIDAGANWCFVSARLCATRTILRSHAEISLPSNALTSEAAGWPSHKNTPSDSPALSAATGFFPDVRRLEKHHLAAAAAVFRIGLCERLTIGAVDVDGVSSGDKQIKRHGIPQR